MLFFPFAEDHIHNVHQAAVIISTGSSLSFYENPYVRTWLTSLDYCHWPIYQIKLSRLILCVLDITQKEVSTLMCCKFYIWFIICSHLPSFHIYFILLYNCSFSAAVISPLNLWFMVGTSSENVIWGGYWQLHVKSLPI